MFCLLVYIVAIAIYTSPDLYRFNGCTSMLFDNPINLNALSFAGADSNSAAPRVMLRCADKKCESIAFRQKTESVYLIIVVKRERLSDLNAGKSIFLGRISSNCQKHSKEEYSGRSISRSLTLTSYEFFSCRSRKAMAKVKKHGLWKFWEVRAMAIYVHWKMLRACLVAALLFLWFLFFCFQKQKYNRNLFDNVSWLFMRTD